jgi:hypothetical protein
MSEINLMRKIMKELSKLGARVFRNNVGEAWVGRSRYITKANFYRCEAGDVIIKNARRFHGGLDTGSADIIGWTPVEITPDMVGDQIAVFTSIEVKKDEDTSAHARKSKQKSLIAQQNFARAVKKSGGYSGFAGSVDEAVSIIQRGA